MSGASLPARARAEVREWKVEDPIGKPEELYTKVCEQIENLVMQLILELRPRRARVQPPNLVPVQRSGRKR